MADPWSNTTPTNANTVRDTVPQELIALKQVNLDRMRLICSGTAPIGMVRQAGNLTAFGVVRYNQDALFRGLYSGGAGSSGEYTTDQDGWYKVVAGLERICANQAAGSFRTSTTVESLIVQKFTVAAGWTDVRQAQVPGTTGLPVTGGSSGASPFLFVEAVFRCDAGDKIRVRNGVGSGTAFTTDGLVPESNPTMNYMHIEFLRNL